MERSCESCGRAIVDDGSGVPLCGDCLGGLGLEIWTHEHLVVPEVAEEALRKGTDGESPGRRVG